MIHHDNLPFYTIQIAMEFHSKEARYLSQENEKFKIISYQNPYNRFAKTKRENKECSSKTKKTEVDKKKP
jgi:hypothetical protein